LFDACLSAQQRRARRCVNAINAAPLAPLSNGAAATLNADHNNAASKDVLVAA
jgi:hypothetical protein